MNHCLLLDSLLIGYGKLKTMLIEAGRELIAGSLSHLLIASIQK